MKKVSIIFSSDYDFQVIGICPNMNTHESMEVANKMYSNGELKEAGIENYDTAEFDSIKEANEWILEQVSEGRKLLHKKPVLNGQQKIESELGTYTSHDAEDYPKIINALKKALKKSPDKMVDDVEFDAGDNSEVRMETISMWQKVEYVFTVKEFCELVGIK